MKALGLDVASTTGWSLVEDDKLLEFGSIQLISSMTLPQRLNFLYNEISRVITKTQPDICCIEDLIFGLSGVKILAYLARLNGVAINACYSCVKDKMKIYNPPQWKKNSIDGIIGSSKKWKIQFQVIKHFNIPLNVNYDEVDKLIESKELNLISCKNEIIEQNNMKLSLKKKLLYKTNPLRLEERKEAEFAINEIYKRTSELKKQSKILEKLFEKEMLKVSLDITAQTSISPDIADSCCIAVCGLKEMKV